MDYQYDRCVHQPVCSATVIMSLWTEEAAVAEREIAEYVHYDHESYHYAILNTLIEYNNEDGVNVTMQS